MLPDISIVPTSILLSPVDLSSLVAGLKSRPIKDWTFTDRLKPVPFKNGNSSVAGWGDLEVVELDEGVVEGAEADHSLCVGSVGDCVHWLAVDGDGLAVNLGNDRGAVEGE